MVSGLFSFLHVHSWLNNNNEAEVLVHLVLVHLVVVAAVVFLVVSLSLIRTTLSFSNFGVLFNRTLTSSNL